MPSMEGYRPTGLSDPAELLGIIMFPLERFLPMHHCELR
ncbi:hypothetical protein AWB69_08122 [Caballeronia udeis]|uniref:Uncharacterized protein n=1 Tax=Caballeronia udeis TaxID=1232866 RepID=A0A158JKI6_9BURK|nr:hypothetical protein AWB69_08122 [Caballeronia udeis]